MDCKAFVNNLQRDLKSNQPNKPGADHLSQLRAGSVVATGLLELYQDQEKCPDIEWEMSWVLLWPEASASQSQSRKLSAVSLSPTAPLQLYLAVKNCCRVHSGALCLWVLGLCDPPYLKKAEEPLGLSCSSAVYEFCYVGTILVSWCEENFRNPASGYVFWAKSHLSCLSCKKKQIRNSDRWEPLKKCTLFCLPKGFWQFIERYAFYYHLCLVFEAQFKMNSLKGCVSAWETRSCLFVFLVATSAADSNEQVKSSV